MRNLFRKKMARTACRLAGAGRLGRRALAWTGVALAALGFGSAALASEGGDALRAQIERYVRERAPFPPSVVDVPTMDAFAQAWTAPGDVLVRLSTSPRERFVGTVPITITVLADGAEVKRGVVTAQVRAMRPVLVARHDLERGDLVREEDVGWEERDVSTLPDRVVFMRDEVVGKRVRRRVGAGTLWRTGLLTEPTVIQRGQMVRLRFQRGPLRIAGLGKAREEGELGELIRIQNVDSRREVMGRVRADGEVDVEL